MKRAESRRPSDLAFFVKDAEFDPDPLLNLNVDPEVVNPEALVRELSSKVKFVVATPQF